MENPYAKIRIIAKGVIDGWLPVAVIFALTAALLYQQWQIKRPQLPLVLKVGDIMPTVTATDLQGASREVRFRSDSRTLLYVFSPQCVWCQRNMSSFAALVQQAQAFRIVAVSLSASGLEEFLKPSRLDGSKATVYVLSDQARRQLRLAVTPETVLISKAGLVENVWPGAYAGKIGEDVEAALGVKLPTLPAPSQPGAENGITVVR